MRLAQDCVRKTRMVAPTTSRCAIVPTVGKHAATRCYLQHPESEEWRTGHRDVDRCERVSLKCRRSFGMTTRQRVNFFNSQYRVLIPQALRMHQERSASKNAKAPAKAETRLSHIDTSRSHQATTKSPMAQSARRMRPVVPIFDEKNFFIGGAILAACCLNVGCKPDGARIQNIYSGTYLEQH